ncbi:MAG: hypothetical protein IT330_07665 [Anaerolineae bacterium]|nr:hypothetical protein [Anaerolineae bacterium]
MLAETTTAKYELSERGPLATGTRQTLRFYYHPTGARPPDARLWLMLDVRQEPGVPQHAEPGDANYVSASAASGQPTVCEAYLARTLDLYPRVPEFLYVCEVRFPQGLPADDTVTIQLGSDAAGWEVPRHPIEIFRFWFLESEPEGWRFEPTGYKTYRAFADRSRTDDLPWRLGEMSISVTGDVPRLSAANTRPTPGILWGDIHGMVFNQRPLDDYYRYAREVARFDFAAAMLFSYNVCVDGVWQEIKAAAARWTEPGRFLGIAGVESGTVPDGSHRNAYYFDAANVPPIFCEDRPPARDPRLTRRFHPDTILCHTLDDYYHAVFAHGGIVTGHFHTLRYDREVLAEIWQKQVGDDGDEAHVFAALNSGLRLGLVAGSDTHDSMPGNPEPEPWCPQPAGFMAVLADEVSASAIREAIWQRRVYGTTGARIALRVESNEMPMGSVLPAHAPRQFAVRVEGSGPLAKAELIRNGAAIQKVSLSDLVAQVELADPKPGNGVSAWYLVKITQIDGHRAWSSPIWFEE